MKKSKQSGYVKLKTSTDMMNFWGWNFLWIFLNVCFFQHISRRWVTFKHQSLNCKSGLSYRNQFVHSLEIKNANQVDFENWKLPQIWPIFSLANYDMFHILFTHTIYATVFFCEHASSTTFVKKKRILEMYILTEPYTEILSFTKGEKQQNDANNILKKSVTKWIFDVQKVTRNLKWRVRSVVS